MQGYLVSSLTEILKYMRRPCKRSAPSTESAFASQRQSKGTVARPSTFTHSKCTGEDGASHERNVKVLQSMANLVSLTLIERASRFVCLHAYYIIPMQTYMCIICASFMLLPYRKVQIMHLWMTSCHEHLCSGDPTLRTRPTAAPTAPSWTLILS